MTSSVPRGGRGLRRFSWALAFVGLLTLGFPIVDLVLATAPFDFGAMEWRYQFTGRMSQMLMTPVLGIALLAAAGHLGRSRGVLLTSRILGWGGAALVLGLTILFVVDGSVAAEQIPEDAQGVFRLGAIRAIVKNILTVGAFGLLGWSSVPSGSVQRATADTGSQDGLFGT